MLTPTNLLRTAAVLLLGGGGLMLLSSFGSLQWPTVFVYTGLVIMLLGLLCMIRPIRLLGWSKRWNGLPAVVIGGLVTCCGLWWPVSSLRSASTTTLNSFLPEYHFSEYHSLDIRAPADRTMAAVRQITFTELGAIRTLGKIRNVALGHFGNEPPLPAEPILGLISAGSTGFFPLYDGEREYVFGMAGQPWNNRAIRLTSKTFGSWAPPEQVKIACDVRVEELANGWSRVSTETRVQATDETAQKKMARYWRFIYPGSGMIRNSMLTAIRHRAEEGL